MLGCVSGACGVALLHSSLISYLSFPVDLSDPTSFLRLSEWLAQWGVTSCWARVSGHISSPAPLTDFAGAPAAVILTRTHENRRFLLGLGSWSSQQDIRMEEAHQWGLARTPEGPLRPLWSGAP